MAYIVFARRYRPQTFDDIIGQGHIVTTLKNAISQDRVAHAYLFAGPRGIGKTTTARIFSKALNCEKGPTIKPCNACPSCMEIAKASSLDVLEIDGASNRGIDEIRALRENVKFAPAKGHFKIYIIDEVHMLTAEAFNALLKTLEEPPPHVKFIFATTQPYKVPATILSRCQRFDFRRIATKDIAANLKAIAKKENFVMDDEALGLIAKYADGSLRDGQVILDQIASVSGGKVSLDDVVGILGVVDDSLLFAISGAVASKDSVTALKIIERVVNDGKDLQQLVSGLIEHFRNIAVASISRDLSSLIDAGEEKLKRYRESAEKFTVEETLYAIYALSNAMEMMRKTALGRIPLEAALVKLTRPGSIPSLSEIADRIDRLASGAAAQRSSVDAAGQSSSGGLGQADAAKGHKQASYSQDAGLDDIVTSWSGVINFVKSKKISIASYLQEGYPINLDGNTLVVGFPKEFAFHKEMLESADNRKLVEEAITGSFGKAMKISFVISDIDNGPRRGLGADEAFGSASNGKTAEASGEDMDPIVKAALEMFGAQPRGGSGEKKRSL